jgi:hypothetical protein
VLGAKNKGGVDAAADREFLYVLRVGPAVSVLDNTGLNHGVTPRIAQNFDLSAYGPRVGFQGMAIYHSS